MRIIQFWWGILSGGGFRERKGGITFFFFSFFSIFGTRLSGAVIYVVGTSSDPLVRYVPSPSLSLLMYSIPNDSRLPLGCVCVCWPLRTTVSLYNFFVPPSPVMDLNSWPFSSSSRWMVDEARHYDMCRPCRCRCTQHLLRFRRVE